MTISNLKFSERLTPDDINFELFKSYEVIEELERALNAYNTELYRNGYSALTSGSYVSAAGRFIMFLKQGKVVPDKEQ